MYKVNYKSLLHYRIYFYGRMLVADVRWLILDFVATDTLVDVVRWSTVCKVWKTHIRSRFRHMIYTWFVLTNNLKIIFAKMFLDFMIRQYHQPAKKRIHCTLVLKKEKNGVQESETIWFQHGKLHTCIYKFDEFCTLGLLTENFLSYVCNDQHIVSMKLKICTHGVVLTCEPSHISDNIDCNCDDHPALLSLLYGTFSQNQDALLEMINDISIIIYYLDHDRLLSWLTQCIYTEYNLTNKRFQFIPDTGQKVTVLSQLHHWMTRFCLEEDTVEYYLHDCYVCNNNNSCNRIDTVFV